MSCYLRFCLAWFRVLLSDRLTLNPLELSVPGGLFPLDLAFQGFCVSRGLRLGRLFASQPFPQLRKLRLRPDAKLRLLTQPFPAELTVGERPRVIRCDGHDPFKGLQRVAIRSTGKETFHPSPIVFEGLLLARLTTDLWSRRGHCMWSGVG